MKHILNIVLTVIFGIMVLSLLIALCSQNEFSSTTVIGFIIPLILFGSALICSIIKLAKKKSVQNLANIRHAASQSPSINIDRTNLEIRDTQFGETINLLENTTNYETFLGRMDFAFRIIYETKSQSWLNYLTENAVGLTTRLIDRAVVSESEAIEKLKTESGKQNRFDKFSKGILSAFKDCDTFYTNKNLDYLTTRLDEMKNSVFTTIKFSFQYQINVENKPNPLWTENVSDEVRERFATAIFLYNVRKGMTLGNSPDDYPQYYKYELNVPHPEQLHRKLLADGLLTTADIKTRLEALTIPENKDILSNYNLPVSGKKEKLVTTALENIPEEELNNNVGCRNLTMLSDNGKSFLSLTEGYADLYRCGWGIYLYEYEELREQGILNFCEAAEIILKKHDRKPSILTKLHLAQLYYKQKEYDYSLRYYIQTMFYDTCERYIAFSPQTLKRVHKMAEYFTDDMIEQCYVDNPKAKSYMSKTKFAEAVHKALQGEEIETIS